MSKSEQNVFRFSSEARGSRERDAQVLKVNTEDCEIGEVGRAQNYRRILRREEQVFEQARRLTNARLKSVVK